MIIHDIEQGTDEWLKLRMGVPTASRFKDIYTSTGKASTSQAKYINELVADCYALGPLDSYTNEAMQRGTELEPEARTYYELESGNAVEQVGFVFDDVHRIGASPDGLTALGGLEIKCPSAHKHIEYIRGGKCPAEYFPQVQGCMLICDRRSWDFVSYHPDIKKQLIVTVERDEKWLAGFLEEVAKFHTKLTNALSQMEAA